MAGGFSNELGSCRQIGETGYHQGSEESGGDSLEIVRPLENGDVCGKIFFMHSPEGSEKISQSGPDSFDGVAVDFPDSVPIVVACPFFFRVVDRGMPPSGFSDMVVGVAFVGVERSVGLGVRLNLRLERLLFGVLTNGETDLSGLPSEHAEDRGAVVSHRATPLALVGSTAGGILRIRMQLALLSGVLEHLVGLGLPVTQRGLGLVLQSELLDAAPVLQQVAAVQPQLFGQMRSRDALEESPHQQRHDPDVVMAPRPERSSEKMIHRSAEAAFVFENRGPSGVVGGLSHRKRVTAGAAQALWVESALQVVVALLFTQQSLDGKLDHLRIPAGRLSIQKDHNTPKQHRLHLFADMSQYFLLREVLNPKVPDLLWLQR